MTKYYVNNNAQYNGDHEVHKHGCYWLQQATSVKDLGYHSTCFSAVTAARQHYRQVNGCKTCANSCHTG